MLPAASPRKKPKSPGVDTNINLKASVTCTNVPEGLFDATVVKKHFCKFGQVQKIKLFPKRSMCIIEYEQPKSAERAVLNAGAFDGFMFDVTMTKNRIRRKSKRDDDPDWVPNSEVEEELNAMGGAPSYRLLRDKTMDVVTGTNVSSTKTVNRAPLRKKLTPKKIEEKSANVMQQTSGIESPVLVKTVQTKLSTFEAAAELNQLRSKISLTPDEQWRTLDARDRILRAWGGAGSRVKVGGPTIGTCPDMCPEKELLHRQSEHQVMTLETIPGSDGELEPLRAVKQYSRSSADQEIPMCYELRPALVLLRTCSYLLHEIADTTRQVTLADWFHFMWDRMRSIRKDITQQALCCAESIRLIEMCARFHAHCAARLADLEHTQFDQKLNTDNLTKCLQTIKYMYTDVDKKLKPNEAEFRGYIALLNLGDSNFWWEIKQLPQEIQKSKDIAFAIQIFNALDNNNYVRFFRIIKEKASYLQACILLRYFNDVRARGLARMVKAYSLRGGSRFPAENVMNAFAFESFDNMVSFISHYGLRLSRIKDLEPAIILDRHHFIEDSDPYPITRAIELIESKRKSTICEVIAGGQLPKLHYEKHDIYTSFEKDGKIKESALIAKDQGYNTINDTNKDVNVLKNEIQKLAQNHKSSFNTEKSGIKTNLAMQAGEKQLGAKSTSNSLSVFTPTPKLFSFTPAIPVAPTEIIKNSPEKVFETGAKNVFSFSKPNESPGSIVFAKKDLESVFRAPINKNTFEEDTLSNKKNIFPKLESNKESFVSSKNIFSRGKFDEKKSVFAVNTVSDSSKNVFGKPTIINTDKVDGNNAKSESIFNSKNVFSASKDNIFAKTDTTIKFDKSSNIFAKAVVSEKQALNEPPSIFGSFAKSDSNIFMKQVTSTSSIEPTSNGNILTNKLSPSSLFKSVAVPTNSTADKNYFIFNSKNKAQTVADNILNSVNNLDNHSVYEFNENGELKEQEELHYKNNEKLKEQEIILQQKLKVEEINRRRQEEERLLKETEKKEKELNKLKEIKRQEELKRVEEKRKMEEKRKQELQRKLEEERKVELERKAEEKKKFNEAVEKESTRTVDELIDEVTNDTLCSILKEEMEFLQKLVKYVDTVTEEILTELNKETCICEMKAEIFWTKKTMKKWFHIWRSSYIRNCRRRKLLDNTPVWLNGKTTIEEALHIRRPIENATLKNMNALHRGYKFTGELKTISLPDPYNIMELIRSPLLKRMKQIHYPYDKCFFWKASIVLSDQVKWIYKNIHLDQWIRTALSDNKEHESENLIHVGKQSWNHLMDFAISICLINMKRVNYCTDAMEGTNGIIFYFTEEDSDFLSKIEETLKHKYQYQVIPIVIVIAKSTYMSLHDSIQELMSRYVVKNIISAFRIFVIDPENVSETLNIATRNAIKWMAKKYPHTPPLEIDSLKSICQRYLGNEIWCKLKIEHDSRMNKIHRDLSQLISCYNIAVDKLTNIITNEEHFNYLPFPIEFIKYLDETSPYPKPYEFIPSSVKNTENTTVIKNIMKQLKLPPPTSIFSSVSLVNIQEQIRSYCYQIGWFDNPEEVVCKVITTLPNAVTNDLNVSDQNFSKYFQQFSLIDVLNIIVYEKINRLEKFDNRFAIYEKSVLQDYCNIDWLYETDILQKVKYSAIEYEDDVNYFIEAKRRKINIDSYDTLILEDKDQKLVDESVHAADKCISKYNNCNEAVTQLQLQLEEGEKKSIEFENMLKAALSNVNNM